MLKDYLCEKGISIYAASRATGIPYSTLNDLANCKVDLENCKLGMVLSLSSYLDISIEELMDICRIDKKVVSTSYGVDANINVRNKSYTVAFEYDDENIEMELCKVNEDTSYYIDSIAKWRTEEYIRRRRMEEVEWRTTVSANTKGNC